MNITSQKSSPLSLLLAACAFAGASLHAQTFIWVPTIGATNYDWNVPSNWNPNTSFPTGAGVVANVNNDIAGNQTIRLRQFITVGTLNLGDDVASGNNFGFSISNATGDVFGLTFDSGATGVAAQLNLNATGTPTNNIAVPVTLASNLAINLGSGTQRLDVTTVGGSVGSLDLGSGANARNVTVTGGTTGQNQFTLTNDLAGTGTFTNNGNATVIMSGTPPKTFTGTFVLNKGVGASNTGSLTVTNSSIANAAEVIINGALSAGVVQSGGSLHSGNQSSMTTNPGQRLTQNRITFNGGTLNVVGQVLSGAALNTLVQDNVSVLDFHSGYSLTTIAAQTGSTGTLLNVATLQRSPGATGFVRAGTLAGTAQLLVGNSATFLKGAGGAEGSTTISIIPWLTASNTNAFAGSSDFFATYAAGGIRALISTEFASSITAGPGANVGTGAVTVPAGDTSDTVNSLRYTVSGTGNIGAGKTLIIGSGAVSFASNNGTIGGSGNAAAGTLQFGAVGAPAEGVVWMGGTNSNTIGAAITGTMGLTKAGTGTLVLTGANSFTGTAYVSAGTLQIGDGTFSSNLGITGDVGIANGALLSLLNGNAIADNASVRLENFGLLNGKISLAAGVNETVGGLFFGAAAQLAGTWGSSTSGATYQNDTFFAGTGVLTVVPEPASAALLLLSATALLGLRRRRA